MAKNLYVGINGVAQEAKKIYVGVNDTAKKVIKGFVGDSNNVPRLFYEDIPEIIEEPIKPGCFWFNYATSTGTDIIGKRGQTTININKLYEGIVFFFIIKGLDSDDYYDIIVLDPTNQNSGGQTSMGIYHEAIYDGSTHYISGSWTYSMNGDRWYYGLNADIFRFNGTPLYPTDYSPNCLLDYSDFIDQSNTTYDVHDLVRNYILPNFIYTDDFAEDYQVGQTYNLVKANIEKTIRKFLGIYIYKMVSYKDNYSTAYSSILANIENIVTYFLQHTGNNDIIDLCADYNDNNGFRLGAYYSNNSVNNVTIEHIENKSSNGGYTSIETNAYISYNSCVYIDFNGDGTITYNTPDWTAEEYLYIGKNGYGWDYLHWSNIGLNFT